jgi:cobalt-precorrin-7 (C5)-methyltransferase
MICCIGVGPGDLSYLTQKGTDEIRNADVVAGFDAVVNIIRPLINSNAEIITMGYRDQTDKLALVAEQHRAGKRCVVGFMGDIHFSGFQYLERIERACGHTVETIPGISSAQILASKARVCFDETTFVTFHRRGDLEPFKKHLVGVLKDDRNAIIIPRPWDLMPKDIAAYLLAEGVFEEHSVEVWEQLTRGDAAWKGRLIDCTLDFSDMCIMLVRTLNPLPSQIEPASKVVATTK